MVGGKYPSFLSPQRDSYELRSVYRDNTALDLNPCISFAMTEAPGWMFCCVDQAFDMSVLLATTLVCTKCQLRDY